MQVLSGPIAPTLMAFFFDFDGTLVELASTPDNVLIQSEMVDLLREWKRLTDGAVAIISGREINSIDSFLNMPDLPIAGLHGAERRDANGIMQRIAYNDEPLLHMEQTLSEIVSANPGMLIEMKGTALALHYRNAPDREPIARIAIEHLIADYPGVYVLQPGKMVYEIKPQGVDKGHAVRAFLNEPPFAGRMPVFIGDDLTDEKGFAAVNKQSGLSIKVGDGDTTARARLDSVDKLLAWLSSIVAQS